jgi:hypothetical protein
MHRITCFSSFTLTIEGALPIGQSQLVPRDRTQ